MQFLFRFLESEEGPTSVEYAVMLALILGMIIAAVTSAGGALDAYFQDSATKLNEAVNH